MRIDKHFSRRFLHIGVAGGAALLVCFGMSAPVQAVSPLVRDYLQGVEALRGFAAVPPEEQEKYRDAHREELEAAVRTVESASDVWRYTLTFNHAIVSKYGHAVICNYDEEVGPRVDKLVANHIDRLVKSNVAPNEARRATLALYVDELVLGEMLDEFPCP